MIALWPSPRAPYVMLVLHVLVALAWATLLSAWWCVLIAPVLYLSWRRIRRELQSPWQSLHLGPLGEPHFVLAAEARLRDACLTGYRVSAWAVWLQWQPAQGSPDHLMLWRDQMDADAWRHLRVWLRVVALGQIRCAGAVPSGGGAQQVRDSLD